VLSPSSRNSSSSTLDVEIDEWTERAFVNALCTAFDISSDRALGLEQILLYPGGADPSSYVELLMGPATGGTGGGDGKGGASGAEGGGAEGGGRLPAKPATSTTERFQGDPLYVRWMVCWGILVVAVVPRRYDARARGLLRRVARELRVPWQVYILKSTLVLRFMYQGFWALRFQNFGQWLAAAEAAFSLEIAHIEDDADVPAKKQQTSKMAHYAKMGAATLVGGAIIGASGVVAAPAAIAAVALVGGSMATGAATVTMGVSFGAFGAGLVGVKYARREAMIKEWAFDLVDSSPGLPITIGIAGWLDGREDSHWKVWDKPFCDLTCDGGDALALRWESEELRAVGAAMYTFIRDQAVSQLQSVAGTAVMGAAFNALTLPLALVQACDMIDNAWDVAMRRADRAALELAQVLVSRVHGHRPVTLVGFGLGARVILRCLLELYAMGEAGRGIVETAALLGTPYGVEVDAWCKASAVCGHRLINGYTSSDWMLKLVYRSSSFKRKIAGLDPVEAPPDTRAARVIENLDLSSVVEHGHTEYREKLTAILHMLGLSSGVALPPPPSKGTQSVFPSNASSPGWFAPPSLSLQAPSFPRMFRGASASALASPEQADKEARVAGGGQLPPGYVFENGELKYIGSVSEGTLDMPDEGAAEERKAFSGSFVKLNMDEIISALPGNQLQDSVDLSSGTSDVPDGAAQVVQGVSAVMIQRMDDINSALPDRGARGEGGEGGGGGGDSEAAAAEAGAGESREAVGGVQGGGEDDDDDDDDEDSSSEGEPPTKGAVNEVSEEDKEGDPLELPSGGGGGGADHAGKGGGAPDGGGKASEARRQRKAGGAEEAREPGGAHTNGSGGDVEPPSIMSDLKGLVGAGAGAAGKGVGTVTGGLGKGIGLFTNVAKAMTADLSNASTAVAAKAKSGVSDAVKVSAHIEKVKRGASFVGNVASAAAADAKSGLSKGFDTARSAADVNAHLDKAKSAASAVGNVAAASQALAKDLDKARSAADVNTHLKEGGE